jgi:long-chain fatty acid transport protein
MRRFLSGLVLILFIFSGSVFANGLSLNSVGTKALSMGGAFVGLADDATAIYWNPAGLAGQKSSLQFFFTGVMPSGSYKTTGVDAKTKSNIYPTGGLLGVYNMDKWAFGLGVYVPAGLGAEWDLADFGVPSSANLELLSEIGVVNISPSVAYQVNDKFSIGVAVNISYAMFDMRQQVSGADAGLGLYQFEETSTGLGYGATIGLKYKFNDQLSAGATFRLASKVSMSGTAKNPLFPALPTIPGVIAPGPGESDFDRDVTWPIWIAGGFAYKPSKKLTLTFDAQYSQWSELDKLVATYDDAYWQAALSAEGDNEFQLDWKDAVQIRLGGEYMVSDETALRFGYYYDPAPAPDETLNVLFPSSTNHVGTLGIGHSFGKYRVDAAAEYLFGAERKIDPPAAQPGTHQLDVFAFSIGFGMEL